MNGGLLSPRRVLKYSQDGYVVLDGLLTSRECDELRQRMAEIVDRMDVPQHCRTTFSTSPDQQQQQVRLVPLQVRVASEVHHLSG